MSLSQQLRRISLGLLGAFALNLGLTAPAASAEVVGRPDETPEQRDARMKWWREAASASLFIGACMRCRRERTKGSRSAGSGNGS